MGRPIQESHMRVARAPPPAWTGRSGSPPARASDTIKDLHLMHAWVTALHLMHAWVTALTLWWHRRRLAHAQSHTPTRARQHAHARTRAERVRTCVPFASHHHLCPSVACLAAQRSAPPRKHARRGLIEGFNGLERKTVPRRQLQRAERASSTHGRAPPTPEQPLWPCTWRGRPAWTGTGCPSHHHRCLPHTQPPRDVARHARTSRSARLMG